MRNLKKILALALALVMAFSLMTVASASYSDFTDSSSIAYEEAVQVLSNLGVFKGKNTTATFAPKDTITRAEVAAIIYRIATGDVNDAQIELYARYAASSFKDVAASNWAAGYIGYCANAEYIVGDGTGKFNPTDTVTGYQALAMILRAVGYDQNNEFKGSNWQINVASIAKKLGITDTVSGVSLSTAASRELVAELLFRTIAYVPTVTYTAALGYSQTSTSVGGVGSTNATLGEQTFGLEKTAGEITAVGRTAGTTEIITSTKTVTVAGTDTPWTDIGYGAYVYTVPTAGAKTLTAVSDVIITGESVKVTTDKSTFDTDKMDNIDGFNVYYNGKLVGTNANLEATYTVSGAIDTASEAVGRIGNRGVKVDYVDNDGQGLAEALVITEYTVADITGIATDTTTSGTNATSASTVYFTTGSTTTSAAAAYVVSNVNVAVGDTVTYVDYKGLDAKTSRYTVVAPSATAAFTAVGRDNVTKEVYYTIGGEDMYKSEITLTAWVEYLKAANTGNKVTYFVDPYGYVIKANEAVTVSQCVLGISNDHTQGTTGLANSYIVAADGSVQNVSIAVADGVSDLANNAIREKMYAYTSSVSVLKTIGTAINSISYTAGKTGITLNGNTYYVNNSTVVIDVTDVLDDVTASTTVYTGRTGDDKIPSMDDAEGWYLVDSTGYVSLMFVWDTDTDTSDHFLVYSIDKNIVSAGAKYVTINVIRDGALDTVTLPAEEWDKIATEKKGYGVGVYDSETDANSITEITNYTSYSEIWSKLAWKDNTIALYTQDDEGNDVLKTSYSYNDSTTFTVINVTNDSYAVFGMVSGMNYLLNNTSKTYGFVESTGNVANHIYVIVGEEVGTSEGEYGWTVTETNSSTGEVVTYYVADDGVTTVKVTTDAQTRNIYIDGNYYKSVACGATVTLPEGTVGTGYKVGDEYVAYGDSYPVPVGTTDIKFESGYVAWTLNNNDPVPVKYSSSEGTSLKTALGDLDGNYVFGAKANNVKSYRSVSGNWIPNFDATFVDGYYRVDASTVNSASEDDSETQVTYQVKVNGNVVTDKTFYVQSDDVITVTQMGNSEDVVSYGQNGDITDDIVIEISASTGSSGDA